MDYLDLKNRYNLMNDFSYFEEIAFCFDKVVETISSHLIKLGYKKVICSSSDLDNLLDSVKEYPTRYFEIDYNNLQINTLGIYEREIEEARTDMVDVLGIYDNASKELFNIPLVSGKNAFDEDEYQLVNPLSKTNGKLVAFSKITKKNNKFVVKTSLNKDFILSSLICLSDEEGLIFPSKVASNQIVIIPIKGNEAGVLKRCREVKEELLKANFRVNFIDKQNASFNEEYQKYRSQGVSLIISIGPKDLEVGKVEVYKRNETIKLEVSNENLVDKIKILLNEINVDLYNRQLKNLLTNLPKSKTFDESINQKIPVCSSKECEDILKKNNKIVIMPFTQQMFSFKCALCGGKASKIISLLNF